MGTDRLGTWTTEKCSVFSSSFANCQNLVLDNTSDQTLEFDVELPDDVYIESIAMPRPPVLNGTTVQLLASVQNPNITAAYVILSCELVKPTSERTTVESRKGIEATSGAVYTFDIDANMLGVWKVENCRTQKSASPDYSNPVETYRIDRAGQFEVIKGTDLRILSYSIPSQASSGANAVLSFNVKNPSNTRYGRISCSYRTPQNVPMTSMSSCVQVAQDATVAMPVNVFVSSQGIWSIESCSALASINSDCSVSTTHDTISPVGSFVSSGGIGAQTVELSDVVIENVAAAASGFTNSRTNAIVTVRNKNPVNATFGHVSCAFTDPSSITTRQTSQCYQLNAAGIEVFGIPITLNSPGTWTRDCQQH
jgi:hypothetical protein